MERHSHSEARPTVPLIVGCVRTTTGHPIRATVIGVLNVNQGMPRTGVIQELGGFSERYRDYGIDPRI